MHEFRRFIQAELDARGWIQADLVRRSGLSRAHVSKLVNDPRPALGQMPDESTLEGLAQGFGVNVDVVRTAASRALAGYVDGGDPITVELEDVSTDALLHELRRRIEATEERRRHDTDTAPQPEPRTETSSPIDLRAGQAARERPMTAADDPTAPPPLHLADAARAGESEAERRRREDEGEGR